MFATIDVVEHVIYLASATSLVIYVASSITGLYVSIRVWKLIRRVI